MNKASFIAIGWVVLTAILTALFKPQTPEQYARIAVKYPRLADWLRVLGALGIDPIKAVMIIRDITTKPPPSITIPPPEDQ